MPKVTAQEFRDTLDGLRDAMGSLKGCLKNEIPNEARILRNWINRVEVMNLTRANCQLEGRRNDLVERAERVIADRTLPPPAEFPNS